MTEISLTGSNGFIGSRIKARSEGRCRIRCITRATQENNINHAGTSTPADLLDIASIRKAIRGSNALIHCAHDAKNEAKNSEIISNILTACQEESIENIVIMGSYVSHDVLADTIDEHTPANPFRFPYVHSKIECVRICEAHLRSNRSQRIIILEPTIVEGDGGSWQRFAKKLAALPSLSLPLGGLGLCNHTSVDTVAEAALRCSTLSTSLVPMGTCERFLINDDRALSWKEWLSKQSSSKTTDIANSNRYLLSNNPARNFLLWMKFHALPIISSGNLHELRPPIYRLPKTLNQKSKKGTTNKNSALEGLDRLTMYSLAVVCNKKAKDFGVID